jgi:hypothetical protein
LVLALLLPDGRAYLVGSLQAFAVVTGTTLALGLAGLAYATMTDEGPFDRAGMLHDFSYLGGYLGIATGSVFILTRWAKSRRALKSSA